MTLRYDPPTVTGGGLWAGTALLRTRMRELFPDAPIHGGYNPRCVQNHRTFPGQARCEFGHRISHHAEARALDMMTLDSTLHRRITSWCLSAEGRSWGVQEIVTGYGPANMPQRWQAGQGWRPYSGPSSHRDHVHVSQTIEAASRRVPPPDVLPPMPNPPPPLPPAITPTPTPQEIDMATAILEPHGTPVDGRRPFYRLIQFPGTGQWYVLAINEARLRGAVATPIFNIPGVALPHPLAQPPLGLDITADGSALVVLAGDGGTFSYAIR